MQVYMNIRTSGAHIGHHTPSAALAFVVQYTCFLHSSSAWNVRTHSKRQSHNSHVTSMQSITEIFVVPCLLEITLFNRFRICVRIFRVNKYDMCSAFPQANIVSSHSETLCIAISCFMMNYFYSFSTEAPLLYGNLTHWYSGTTDLI